MYLHVTQNLLSSHAKKTFSTVFPNTASFRENSRKTVLPEFSSKSTSGETQFSQNLIGSHIKLELDTKLQLTCVVFLSRLVLINKAICKI